ncbi:MAG: hypothetical protein OXU73_00955 [Candidatus Campbellbacteria bacterium]|nr:hypothetical protein [Candidatus Campbellbacteria bacterium]
MGALVNFLNCKFDKKIGAAIIITNPFQLKDNIFSKIEVSMDSYENLQRQESYRLKLSIDIKGDKFAGTNEFDEIFIDMQSSNLNGRYFSVENLIIDNPTKKVEIKNICLNGNMKSVIIRSVSMKGLFIGYRIKENVFFEKIMTSLAFKVSEVFQMEDVEITDGFLFNMDPKCIEFNFLRINNITFPPIFSEQRQRYFFNVLRHRLEEKKDFIGAVELYNQELNSYAENTTQAQKWLILVKNFLSKHRTDILRPIIFYFMVIIFFFSIYLLYFRCDFDDIFPDIIRPWSTVDGAWGPFEAIRIIAISVLYYEIIVSARLFVYKK